jgi:hypothetical protein
MKCRRRTIRSIDTTGIGAHDANPDAIAGNPVPRSSAGK